MAQTQEVRGVATRIVRIGTTIQIHYHGTIVVEFNHDTITLNSGGWQTQTTKTRMNQASNQFDLGYSVFQKNYVWYVGHYVPTGRPVGKYRYKQSIFQDGMMIDRVDPETARRHFVESQ